MCLQLIGARDCRTRAPLGVVTGGLYPAGFRDSTVPRWLNNITMRTHVGTSVIRFYYADTRTMLKQLMFNTSHALPCGYKSSTKV